MESRIAGTAYLFGNNIDTDQIYPGRYLELTESEDIAAHVMEGADDSFPTRFKREGIIVGGTNFGCGSSREHAAITLQSAGVKLVIAESFARIFYRNCINLGLPLLICPGISKVVKEGDEVEVALEVGKVVDRTSSTVLIGQELPPYMLDLLKAGGIKPLLKARVAAGEI